MPSFRLTVAFRGGGGVSKTVDAPSFIAALNDAHIAYGDPSDLFSPLGTYPVDAESISLAAILPLVRF